MVGGRGDCGWKKMFYGFVGVAENLDVGSCPEGDGHVDHHIGFRFLSFDHIDDCHGSHIDYRFLGFDHIGHYHMNGLGVLGSYSIDESYDHLSSSVGPDGSHSYWRQSVENDPDGYYFLHHCSLYLETWADFAPEKDQD